MASDTPQPPQQDVIMSPTVAIIKILNSTAGQLATGLIFVLVIWVVMMQPLLESKTSQTDSDIKLREDLRASLLDAKEITNHARETAILYDKMFSEKLK